MNSTCLSLTSCVNNVYTSYLYSNSFLIHPVFIFLVGFLVYLFKILVNTKNSPKKRTHRFILGTLAIPNKSQVECGICRESYIENYLNRLLTCGHMFHQYCVDPWLLLRSGLCPLCRKVVAI